ncbi:hypothetical protein CCR75_000194 [Bremia lactucae]|uniref:Uncharacterized protein n=1 Tax=Bremia lactucae TaxID=4779 RepID=A0A976FNX4_BRELC|nr:hypothetical protein CCR75_000194 [Bremia lactucae]
MPRRHGGPRPKGSLVHDPLAFATRLTWKKLKNLAWIAPQTICRAVEPLSWWHGGFLNCGALLGVR